VLSVDDINSRHPEIRSEEYGDMSLVAERSYEAETLGMQAPGVQVY